MVQINHKGEKNTFFGKHHSEESKRKISENHADVRGEKNPNFGKHFSDEIKRKISKALKDKYVGEKNFNWKGGKLKTFCEICGKEGHVKQSRIKTGRGRFCSQKCQGIWMLKHMKKKDTSIELAIEVELISRNIPYMKQVPIEGIAVVDFLLADKIIIQADGTFWHSRKINMGRDIAQDMELFFKGYRIFRFTETEINKSVRKCINKFLKEI